MLTKIIIQTIIFILAGGISFAQQRPPVKINMQGAVDSAMMRNPTLKNAQLKIDAAKGQQSNILDFKPTNILYSNGQIHSAARDQSFEILQNFGSPLSWSANAFYNKQLIFLNTSSLVLNIKQVQSQVKSAYLQWVFRYNKLRFIDEQCDLYEKFLQTASTRYLEGDSNLLEKTMAEVEFGKMQSQLVLAHDELITSGNKLRQLIFVNDSIEPVEEELMIYAIPPSADKNRRYSDTIVTSYYKGLSNLKTAEVKKERAKYFPEISVGYFNQQIGGVSGFNGWKAGISIPLRFMPQQSKVKEAKIQQIIAENELQYQQYNTNKIIENLLVELNKYYKQISYYRQNAMKQSEILMNTSVAQYGKGKIGYFEYIQGMSTALEIKLDYLDALNNYNQTAVQLEFYSK
jgi:heavy metal efflux system protein